MDKLPTFKSFCGLLPETAAKLVGYIHMIGFGAAYLGFYSFHVVMHLRESEFTLRSVLSTLLLHLMTEDGILLAAFFGACLVLGVRKGNLDLVFAWMLLQVTTILLSVLAIPFFLVPGHSSTLSYVLHNITLLLIIVIKCTFLLAVNTYYGNFYRGNLINEEETIDSNS